MTLTATQQGIVEVALDHLDDFKGSDQEAAHYAVDQLVNGGCPEYHEGGARPDRHTNDVKFLVDSLKSRLRRIGLMPRDEPEPNAPRTWEEA